MNKQDDMIEVIPIPATPSARWAESDVPPPTDLRRWMDPAAACNKKEGEAPDDLSDTAAAILEDYEERRRIAFIGNLNEVCRAMETAMALAGRRLVVLHSPQSLGKTDGSNPQFRNLLAAMAFETALADLNFDHLYNFVPSAFGTLATKPTAEEPKKQNGRSAAYLKHDRSKQHRRPRRGRGR